MDPQGKPGPTTAQRRQWGRIGALLVHGTGKTNTEAARAKRRLNLERLADPEGILPPEVLAKRVRALRLAHMLKMSDAARRARQSKRPKAA